MPELPDITVYIEALDRRITGARLTGIRLASPFLLRSVDPPLAEFTGKAITDLRRIGKRIALGFEGDLWLVIHLMIAGRLHWAEAGAKLPGGKRGLAGFDFEPGTLILTEAGSKKRASLHAVRGAAGLAAHDPGGIEPLAVDADAFGAALIAGNHTL
ncbi:MAG: formamidopyrimidine-DNA glycosylase, partial [Myxococcales bacterium]|nr:formamidopyrimidine-DNA glycosylase [Myxococcales bacterium]